MSGRMWMDLFQRFSTQALRSARSVVNITAVVLFITTVWLASPPLFSADGDSSSSGGSSFLSFSGYNTRVVLSGTTVLGAAAGLVGVFLLMRRRALLGDAIAHATLPGIATAFLVATAFQVQEKSLPILLLGAAISGSIGGATILAIRNLTKIKEDAALGIVLSVFFGAGTALLGIAQQTQTGHAAGLEGFIYGKAASMMADDVYLIAAAAAIAGLVCILLFKELQMLCFDDGFARSQGWPVVFLDLLLMGLVVTVTIVGLQAVGLILVIALLVVPAAAARFWTNSLSKLCVLASIFGAISGLIGAIVSASVSKVPSGAAIVLVATCIFIFSLGFGTVRGVWWRYQRLWRMRTDTEIDHLLRATFELLEEDGCKPSPAEEVSSSPIPLNRLLRIRSWRSSVLQSAIRGAIDRGWVTAPVDGAIRLTPAGTAHAMRLVREHRLWELYLIHFAELGADQVDRGADDTEHFLAPHVIARLEAMLEKSGTPLDSLLPSPHPVEIYKDQIKP